MYKYRTFLIFLPNICRFPLNSPIGLHVTTRFTIAQRNYVERLQIIF